MKVIIATFSISKQGGIVEYVAAMLKAFRDLGCEVGLAELSPTTTTQSQYDKKVAEFESGEHQRKIKFQSQAGGYQKDEVTGYWRNNYYGYFLPPNNKIGVYEPDALEHWNKLVSDVDIILWNFMPTKSSAWERKDKQFNFWHKFFDLPDSIKQVFLVHDAYFNVRASNISALKDKILFMGCAHIAAYQCCSEIGIPRSLLLNPRYIPQNAKMPVNTKRKIDFFAAHMFKSMKHMEELIAAVPYIDEDAKKIIAGTGIEYNYMTSPTKTKSNYMCSCKRDPDMPKEYDGQLSLWDRAEFCGMEYRGQMSGADVIDTLQNTRFAIDPSWAEHYAQYCRTHINGFIIEAMLNGAYPVLRDYKGLSKTECGEDPLFENIRAIVIPWDATPKQFADALNKARKMPLAKFIADTKHNFELVKELFNATNNAAEIIDICSKGRKWVKQNLECGKDSETVKKITKDIMTDFYGIELPIEWET